MYRPYYYQRKRSPPENDDDSEMLDDASTSSNAPNALRLGIVHPGTYEQWLVQVEKEQEPVWVLNTTRMEIKEPTTSDKPMATKSSESVPSSHDLDNQRRSIRKMPTMSDEEDLFMFQMKKDLELQSQMLRLLKIALKTAREDWAKNPFKLAGLEGRGEAEVLKLLFLVADQPLEDERITAEQTEDLKGQTPYGEFPTIAKCSMTFGNATAMSLALATKFQLFGETVQEQLVVGATYNRLRQLQDKHKRTLAWVMCGQVKDKAKIEWAQGQLLHVILPPAIKEWEKQICSTKGPFLVESGMTLADIAIMDFLDQCSSHVLIDGLLADFLGVSDLLEAVRSCPRLLAHLQDREDD